MSRIPDFSQLPFAEAPSAPPTAAMPPASKKFFAKVMRALKSAGVPSVAKNTCGRAPVAARILSEASRKASNGAARRMRGSATAVAAAAIPGGGNGAISKTAGAVS